MSGLATGTPSNSSPPPPATESALTAASAAGPTPDRRTKLRRFLIVALPTCWLTISIGLLVAGLPDYGRNVAFEQNAMTWVQSTTLMLAALLSVVILTRDWLHDKATLRWALFALGLVLVAIDEQFYFHERLREGAFSSAPQLLPWSPPGELIPPAVALGGLLLVGALVKVMGSDRTARAALVCGAVIGVLALGVDTIDTEPWADATLLAEQTLEEIVEFLAQVLVLLGLSLFALGSAQTPMLPPSSKELDPATLNSERWTERSSS